MEDTHSKYHYCSPHQMQPLLPSSAKLDSLRPAAADLISNAKNLRAHGMPCLHQLLNSALRPMNSFYTNKIEGQHTEPLLIERALHQDYSDKPEEARKQRIAIAHIETEKWGEEHFQSFDAMRFFQPGSVQAIHHHLHGQLTREDLIQTDDFGIEKEIIPGEWRRDGVKVGSHIPPDPATIPRFMDAWHDGYKYQRAGENALIALMAAHHRLAWIHPFLDGNGRTARLHTHLGLASLGLTQGLWSPMRGLARQQQAYYGALIGADRDRLGDYDGRGVLSEKGLIEFIDFFFQICLDQIRFMDDMLGLTQFESRLAAMLAAESTKEETKHLRPEAAPALAYLGTVGAMDRTRFKGMMGLAPRTADRVLSDLFRLGVVTSKTPKGPVELALPLRLFRYLFPRLWPEAEANTA